MSQFKVITNKELPKVSDPSKSQIGRFKKEKNQTKFKWNFNQDRDDEQRDNTLKAKELLEGVMQFQEELEIQSDNEFHNMSVQQEISLEALKNSTI